MKCVKSWGISESCMGVEECIDKGRGEHEVEQVRRYAGKC
jgi:hypothetical protein